MSDQIKLPETTLKVFEYIRDAGGKVSTKEIVAELGDSMPTKTGKPWGIRNLTPSITYLVNKELAVREKVKEGDVELTIVTLTDAGMNFVQPEE